VFDFLGFAEAHSIISTVAVTVSIFLALYIGRDVKRWVELDARKRTQIEELLKISSQLKESLHKCLETCDARCDVAQCPGLANIREEIKERHSHQEVLLADIKTLMVDVAHENKNVFVELLSFIKSTWGPRDGKSGQVR
jgi:hypothetical protein